MDTWAPARGARTAYRVCANIGCDKSHPYKSYGQPLRLPVDKYGAINRARTAI
jgi:hypothetical protein